MVFSQIKDWASTHQGQVPHQHMRQKNLAWVKQKAVFEENIAEELAIMERIAGGKRH